MMLKIILLRAQASITGFESPAAEYTQLGIDLDQLLIDHPSATYLGLADGDSMTGDGIHNGDLLIINRAESVLDGDIIVANLNGSFVCKKVDRKNRSLLSSCPGHRPYVLRDGDEFQVEGVVTRSIRLHRPLNRTF